MNAIPLFSLAGRIALVSGGAGHLGRSMARSLGAAGAYVIVNGRDTRKLDDLVGALAQDGIAAETKTFDVTKHDAVKQAFAELRAKHGRLDVLVNNASAGRPGTIDSATDADFLAATSVTTVAAFHLVRAARPMLDAAVQAAGHASVINIASMYGTVSPDPRIYGESGLNSPPYYGAAKAGLLQLTRYLACHLGPAKIRVNALSPGPFPPAAALEHDSAFGEKLQAKIPLGRTGKPEEIGGAAVFLASDAASYITGVNLPVDGGWTAW